MEIKDILLIIGCLIASVMGFLCLIKILKEINEIKMSSKDRDIKAIVVDAYVFMTSDIRPVLVYTVNGKDKKYVYHFYHKLKEFPIGKEVNLKLSNSSGLAYDKKDLLQGLLFVLFGTIFLWRDYLQVFIVLCLYDRHISNLYDKKDEGRRLDNK